MPRRPTDETDDGRVQSTYRLPAALRDEAHAAAHERAVHPQLLVAAALRFYLDHLPPVAEVLAARVAAPAVRQPTDAEQAELIIALSKGDPDDHVCDCGHKRGRHELVAAQGATLHLCHGRDDEPGPPCTCARFRFNVAPHVPPTGLPA